MSFKYKHPEYENAVTLIRSLYIETEPTTWPYFVIEMPLDENGNGPCELNKCTEIKYEVWDRVCNTVGDGYKSLAEAIKSAMVLNHDLLNNGDD